MSPDVVFLERPILEDLVFGYSQLEEFHPIVTRGRDPPTSRGLHFLDRTSFAAEKGVASQSIYLHICLQGVLKGLGCLRKADASGVEPALSFRI